MDVFQRTNLIGKVAFSVANTRPSDPVHYVNPVEIASNIVDTYEVTDELLDTIEKRIPYDVIIHDATKVIALAKPETDDGDDEEKTVKIHI